MIINKEKLEGCDQRVIDLSEYLDDMAEKKGTNFVASSGIRSKAYNKKIGGSLKSYHVLGLAMDGCFESVNIFKLVTELYYLCEKQEGVFEGIVQFEICRGIVWKKGKPIQCQHFHFAFAKTKGKKSRISFFTGTYK